MEAKPEQDPEMEDPESSPLQRLRTKVLDVTEKIENVLDKRKEPYESEELVFSPTKEPPAV